MKKDQPLMGWLLLILLLAMILSLNYIKFFANQQNEKTREVKGESSNSKAVDLALEEIAIHFNTSPKIEELKEEGITLKADVKKHSIFVSYETHVMNRFEFQYQDLHLNIGILNDKESEEKFRKVLNVMVEAIQRRLGNEVDSVGYLDEFFNQGQNDRIITIEKGKKSTQYSIDITKKISKKEGE